MNEREMQTALAFWRGAHPLKNFTAQLLWKWTASRVRFGYRQREMLKWTPPKSKAETLEHARFFRVVITNIT